MIRSTPHPDLYGAKTLAISWQKLLKQHLMEINPKHQLLKKKNNNNNNSILLGIENLSPQHWTILAKMINQNQYSLGYLTLILLGDPDKPCQWINLF